MIDWILDKIEGRFFVAEEESRYANAFFASARERNQVGKNLGYRRLRNAAREAERQKTWWPANTYKVYDMKPDRPIVAYVATGSEWGPPVGGEPHA